MWIIYLLMCKNVSQVAVNSLHGLNRDTAYLLSSYLRQYFEIETCGSQSLAIIATRRQQRRLLSSMMLLRVPSVTHLSQFPACKLVYSEILSNSLAYRVRYTGSAARLKVTNDLPLPLWGTCQSCGGISDCVPFIDVQMRTLRRCRGGRSDTFSFLNVEVRLARGILIHSRFGGTRYSARYEF